MAFRQPAPIDPITGQPTTVAPNQVTAVHRRRVLVTLVGLLALALGACGTSGATTTDTAAEAGDPGGPTVTIQDLAYTPHTLTVPAGTTVTWVWRDGAITHDVKGDDFRSEIMAEGTFRHRFDQPGSYAYLCTLHPTMTATIEVTR